MGYYTRFGLQWEPKEPEVEIYLEARKDTLYGINPTGKGTEACKWYEHEEDMLVLSKQFPNITFTLSGEGEEMGDCWQKRFINGEQWTSRAEIKFPAFKKGRDEGRK